MIPGMWKLRLDAALSAAARDVGDMTRQARVFIASLDTAERLVLIGLALIGTLYLLLDPFHADKDTKPANGRFVGILFALTAIATGLGWAMSGRSA